jgi:hypothetical protein
MDDARRPLSIARSALPFLPAEGILVTLIRRDAFSL